MFIVRRDFGGGLTVKVRGEEVLHISSKDAKKAWTKAEVLGDMARRLRKPKDQGLITSQEAGMILEMLGRKMD
jgi:hypothetical protein